MKRCSISFETLADFFDGKADATASAQIGEHLRNGCPHCQQNLAWLEHSVATLREVQRVEVPQNLLVRMQALFAERFRAPARPSLLARLQFDSRPGLALAGARGSASEAFKLTYSTDAHDIDLWEERAVDGTWYLIGQVLPKQGDAVLEPEEVVLTSAEGAQVSVTPQMGEFHVPSVVEGVYHLVVRLSDVEVSIPQLSVGMVPS